MLEDFKLKVFLSVAEHHSFTKAAEELRCTQPAVSQNIAELEKMLNRRLFLRQKGETVLTQEGKVFKTYADRMMNTCEEIENMFCRIQPTVVRIAASEELYTYLIGPAIESFTSIHPDVVFEHSLFGDADLTLQLRPSCEEAAEAPGEKIAEIRMSLSPAVKEDNVSAISEKTSSFDVIFKPSESFSCTRLCRLLRQFLIK